MASPFAQIIGHGRIISYLEGVHERGQISHAYLFEGAKHLGKSVVAEIFAALILGISKELSENLPIHPDFLRLELSAAGQLDGKTGDKKEKIKKNIGIEEVRSLIRRLSLSPMHGRAKVAIISDAESMSVEAANALLKTLEEPSGKTVIILISENSESLPQTIVSRVQVLRLGFVPHEILEKGLGARGVEQKLAHAASKLSFGRPGLAIELCKKPAALKFYKDEMLNDLSLLSSPLFNRSKFVEKILPERSAESKERAEIVLNRWELILRDMLSARIGAREAVLNDFAEEELAASARFFSSKDLLDRIYRVGEARELISLNVSPRMALENFFFNL